MLYFYFEWVCGWIKQELIVYMVECYKKLVGIDVGFMQFMIDGVLDKFFGLYSDLVVKIYGNDFGEMCVLVMVV